MAVALLLLSLAAAPVATGSPVAKVIEMLSGLQAKVISEGEESHAVFAKFSEWCEDEARELGFEIKTSQGEIASLKATIEKESASIAEFEAKIEELAAELALDEADLKAATEIRAKEQADFSAEEKELMEVIDTLKRAIAILQREMAKIGSASMLQLQNAKSLEQALTAMVQASLISSTDASKLTSLMQTMQQSDEDDSVAGAPDAAVYQGHADGMGREADGGIIAVLEDLLQKAEAQLDGLRKAETSSLQNFQVLSQNLRDEIKNGNTDLAEAKKGMAASGSAKAEAEGDLGADRRRGPRALRGRALRAGPRPETELHRPGAARHAHGVRHPRHQRQRRRPLREDQGPDFRHDREVGGRGRGGRRTQGLLRQGAVRERGEGGRQDRGDREALNEDRPMDRQVRAAEERGGGTAGGAGGPRLEPGNHGQDPRGGEGTVHEEPSRDGAGPRGRQACPEDPERVLCKRQSARCCGRHRQFYHWPFGGDRVRLFQEPRGDHLYGGGRGSGVRGDVQGECHRQDQQGAGREVQEPGGGQPRQGDRGGEDGPRGRQQGARRRAGGAEEPSRAVRRDGHALRRAEAPARGGDRGPQVGPGDPRGRGRTAAAGPPAAGGAEACRVRSPRRSASHSGDKFGHERRR